MIEDLKEEINISLLNPEKQKQTVEREKSCLRHVKENRINKKNPKQGNSVSENLEIKTGTALAMFTHRIGDVREKSQV